MARYINGSPLVGLIGNIQTYRIRNSPTVYARGKSRLDRNRVLTGDEFAATRKHAGDMARAAVIGSAVYKALPARYKGRPVYRALTGEAASLLYKGKRGEEVKDLLWKKYILKPAGPSTEGKRRRSPLSRLYQLLQDDKARPRYKISPGFLKALAAKRR